MILPHVRRHRWSLITAYSLAVGGTIAGQLYPLATAVAINGVLRQDYWSIGWLAACHGTALILEVSAKMFDTRVFSRLYADIAGAFVLRAHADGVDPSTIAARSSLSREYVNFLERYVPNMLFAVIGLAVSLTTLFWLDGPVGAACLGLVLPLLLINRWLARRSLTLNTGLNDRLEREVEVLRRGRATAVQRHFRALSGWRVRLSDTEAQAYGMMEITVIALFVVALVRLAHGDTTQAGDIYAIFSYLWKYIQSLDQVPSLVQQLAKLKDLNRRLASTS